MSDIITKGKGIHLDCVDSTNTCLKRLSLCGNACFHDYVTADTQTSGRGRLGRSFSSVSGKGMYLSYLVNPKDAKPWELSQITAWGAVAVRDAILEVCGVSAGIKWVNDLVSDGRKLCGILTESVFDGGRVASVVMGIGINVNHTAEDFPEELRKVALSLLQLTGKTYDIKELTLAVVGHLDKMNDAFPSHKAYYLDEYRKSCVVPGNKVRIIEKDVERIGTALGIDDGFGLEVLFEDGKRETVTGGDVSVRGFYGYI